MRYHGHKCASRGATRRLRGASRRCGTRPGRALAVWRVLAARIARGARNAALPWGGRRGRPPPLVTTFPAAVRASFGVHGGIEEPTICIYS